jgi:hypothetical protein
MKNPDYVLVCDDLSKADELEAQVIEDGINKSWCSPTQRHRMFRIGIVVIVLTVVLGVSLPVIQRNATKLRKSLPNNKSLKALLKNCVLDLSADTHQPLNEIDVRLDVPGIFFSFYS